MTVNALNPRHLRGPQRQVARKPSVKPGPHNAGIVETQLRLLMLHLSPYRHAQKDQRSIAQNDQRIIATYKHIQYHQAMRKQTHTRQEWIIIWSGRNWILKHAD